MWRPKKQTLWDRIREVREKRKLTQDQVAKLAKIPNISMSKTETGLVKNPWIVTVTKIARALETSIDSLVEGLFIEKKDKDEK